MTGFSQPERRGLDRMQLANPETHPDADLLTAFAEHALSARERDEVLGHIAACSACREVLALAGSPLVEPVPEPVRKRAFWEIPLFRWGAVAATTVVVIGAVSLGIREHKTSPAMAVMNETLPAVPAPADADKVTVEPPAKVVTEPKRSTTETTAAKSVPKPERRAPHLQQQVRYEVAPAEVAPKEKGEKDAGAVLGGIISGQPAYNAPVPAPPAANVATTGGPISRGATASAGAESRFTAGRNVMDLKQAPAGPASADKTVAQASTQPAVRSVNETVEVSAENAMVQTDSTASAVAPAPAPPASNLSVLTQSESVTVESTKPNKKSLAKVGPLPSLVASTQWQITRKGALQRSVNSGATWETMLADRRFRAVAVVGDHIWAGGDQGSLYFSDDGGHNWSATQVQSGAAKLSGDIIRLRFADAQNGAIDTSTGETWITKDGGLSWHKQ